jgi:predicted nicotinamide N-methyase
MDTAFIVALARAATAGAEPEPGGAPTAAEVPAPAAVRLRLAGGQQAVVHQERGALLAGVVWPAALALGYALGGGAAAAGVLPPGAAAAVAAKGRVLELGCGTALSGLCAWLHGSEEVVVTDRDCQSCRALA